jgi:hypothetical protein
MIPKLLRVNEMIYFLGIILCIVVDAKAKDPDEPCLDHFELLAVLGRGGFGKVSFTVFLIYLHIFIRIGYAS